MTCKMFTEDARSLSAVSALSGHPLLYKRGVWDESRYDKYISLKLPERLAG